MNFKDFTQNALRTESVPDVVRIHTELFETMQAVSVSVADNLDLIKKNVFYGKDLDQERVVRNLRHCKVMLENLSKNIDGDSGTFSKIDEMVINPREFHGVLGILTEANELLDCVNLGSKSLPVKECVDELGDVMWYTAILADEKNIDVEDQVLVAVIDKLRTRFPDKFDAALAISKNKDIEGEVTQKYV